ncbi:MAG: flagellar biosynthesis anti-sigma factor FlgM [Nitrospinae bacterium]|nr:flagellar biosynthesis anti-sigma factor FlgM [Nitrospinota bacterium]
MNKLEPTIKLGRGNTVKGDPKSIKNSDKSSKYSGSSADRVTLSETSKNQAVSKESKNVTGEIRHDLVNKFRNVLRDGNYSIKADEIADKIVQKIRDNKNHLAL